MIRKKKDTSGKKEIEQFEVASLLLILLLLFRREEQIEKHDTHEQRFELDCGHVSFLSK